MRCKGVSLKRKLSLYVHVDENKKACCLNALLFFTNKNTAIFKGLIPLPGKGAYLIRHSYTKLFFS